MHSPATIDRGQTSKARVTRRVVHKVFSFPAFLGMLLVAGAYVGRLGNLVQPSSPFLPWLEGDTWWHLAAAANILKTHTWPTHDIYSFTAFGSPWIEYEWLGDLVLNLFWKLGGLQGLMVFVIVLAGIIMLLLYYYAWLRSKNSKAAFISCSLVLVLASLQFTVRPQMLGYIFLVVTLICLEKFRQGSPRFLWFLPFVFLLWVNTHGTFVLGFLILGVYWASGLREFQFARIYAKRWTSTQRRQLELTFLVCLIASIVTPYGTQLVAYPLKMVSSQHLIVQTVQEWMPLDISQFYGKFFLALLMLFWIGLATSRLTLRLEDFLLLAFATAETFMHARFVLLFVPVFVPLAAELLARFIPKYQPAKDPHALNFVLMAVVIIGTVKSFPSRTNLEQRLQHRVPVKAIQFLQDHPEINRTFNGADWGSYMLYFLGPSHHVFIDGRYDIYQYTGVLADYLAITHLAPDTLFLLRKYRVNSCLISRRSALATLLETSRGWKEVYHDPTSVILVKTREMSAQAFKKSDFETTTRHNGRSRLRG